jgi:hypothetical protein
MLLAALEKLDLNRTVSLTKEFFDMEHSPGTGDWRIGRRGIIYPNVSTHISIKVFGLGLIVEDPICKEIDVEIKKLKIKELRESRPKSESDNLIDTFILISKYLKQFSE